METKGKETENNYEAQIDTTVSTIEGHVEKKSIAGLSGTINKWIDTLEDHKGFKTIAGNLSKLKDAIESKDADKIVSLLATLGEETSKAAEKANGTEATKIKHLGKALTTASKAVAKFS
jgi:hypothetical protein